MDEFDVSHASHEESQAIIDWALAAGALVHILNGLRNKVEPEDELQATNEALEVMMEKMPPLLFVKSEALAQESLTNFIEEEEAVAEFREELEGL